MMLASEVYDVQPDIGRPDGACCIVRDTPDGLVIAFSGTDSLKDVETDADCIPHPLDAIGRVHEGFMDYWGKIRQQVAKSAGTKPVTFTGHSLGAALAILAAAEFIVADLPVKAVYGFEPPCVTPDDKLGAVFAHIPLHLFRNGGDPVPFLPFFWKQPAALTQIGPTIHLPDVTDHFRANVITSLKSIYQPTERAA